MCVCEKSCHPHDREKIVYQFFGKSVITFATNYGVKQHGASGCTAVPTLVNQKQYNFDVIHLLSWCTYPYLAQISLPPPPPPPLNIGVNDYFVGTRMEEETNQLM